MHELEISPDAEHTTIVEIQPDYDRIRAENRAFVERFLTALEREPDLIERFHKLMAGGPGEPDPG